MKSSQKKIQAYMYLLLSYSYSRQVTFLLTSDVTNVTCRRKALDIHEWRHVYTISPDVGQRLEKSCMHERCAQCTWIGSFYKIWPVDQKKRNMACFFFYSTKNSLLAAVAQQPQTQQVLVQTGIIYFYSD